MIELLLQRPGMDKTLFVFLFVIWFFWSCGIRDNQKMFELLNSRKTGITFNNALDETHEMN
ncbi:MAG: hypothetical protein KAI29_18925, partial [Cyclobacteriaceae bacterium]|nr:hypothetical protein [Cyclobacteriaceae bacterium]